MTIYRRPDPLPLPRERPKDPRFKHLAEVQLEAENLDHLVAREIFLAILSGAFPAESVLPNELELAQRLNVSRTALREGIKGLVSKGVVDARRKRGTLVLEPASWNMLDRDLITWQRRAGSTRRVSDSLWEAIQVTLPALAAMASMRRDFGGTNAAAAAFEASATPQRPLAFAQYCSAIAGAGGNQFLRSLIESSLRSLLNDDVQYLARQTSHITSADIRRMSSVLAGGTAGEVTSAFNALLSERSFESR
ncbi:MAG: GntR family transcriptional regulator [Devosia sp.]